VPRGGCIPGYIGLRTILLAWRRGQGVSVSGPPLSSKSACMYACIWRLEQLYSPVWPPPEAFWDAMATVRATRPSRPASSGLDREAMCAVLLCVRRTLFDLGAPSMTTHIETFVVRHALSGSIRLACALL
jgi:hypothetical protein